MKFTFDTAYTKEEAEQIAKQKRLRKFNISYSSAWSCWILAYNK